MNFLINSFKEPKKSNRKKEAEPVVDVKNVNIGFTGSIQDVFGMWKDKKISLEEIREDQWVRKTK